MNNRCISSYCVHLKRFNTCISKNKQILKNISLDNTSFSKFNGLNRNVCVTSRVQFFFMHLGCVPNFKHFLLITNKHNKKLYIDHKVIIKLYNMKWSYCFILFRNQWVKCDLINPNGPELLESLKLWGGAKWPSSPSELTKYNLNAKKDVTL